MRIFQLLILTMYATKMYSLSLRGIGSLRRAMHHVVNAATNAPAAATQLACLCRSKESIESLGHSLSKILDIGDVVFLQGDLGAGKTSFSRGIVRGKLDDKNMIVTSPSYLLDNTYRYGPTETIHHMDLYRLPKGYSEIGILGIPAVFQTSLCIIEWPDRLTGRNIPESYLDISISMLPSHDCIANYQEYKEPGPQISHTVNTDVTSAAQLDSPSGEDMSYDEFAESDNSDYETDDEVFQESLPEPARVLKFTLVGKHWLEKMNQLHAVISNS